MKEILLVENISDNQLLDLLEEELKNIGPEDMVKFYRQVLKGKKPESAAFLIKNDKVGVERAVETAEAQTPSIIFEMQEQQVVVELLSGFSQNVLKVNSKNGLKENILHYAIQKRWKDCIKLIISQQNRDFRNMLFEENLSGNTPIMTILGQEMQETALLMWKYMEEDQKLLGNDDLISTSLKDVLEVRNKKQETLLLMCAGKKHNQLMKTICMSNQMTKTALQKALAEQGPDGQTPLTKCQNEEVLVDILKSVDIEQIGITEVDKKGKNLFHHLAQKDFNLAMEHIISRLPNDQLQDMFLQPSSSNKSNVFMSAAIHSSKKCLKLLLYWISTWRCFNTEGEVDIEKILHWGNDYGYTLLGIALQHKDALQVPIHILLGLESEFHTKSGGEDDLTKCFKENLTPSLEVLEALQEVEKTKSKSWIKTAGIWVTTFLKSFCLPVGLMSLDMGFDVALVSEYSDHDTRGPCLAAQYNACTITTAACHDNTTSAACLSAISTTENILTSECGNDTTLWEWQPTEEQITSAFFCIPLKLELAPRFYYSLAFIVWPWVYYFIEFCQSSIRKHMYQVGLLWVSLFKLYSHHQDLVRAWYQMSWSCKGIWSFFFKLLTVLTLALCHIMFWPFEMHGRKFLSEGRFLTSNGKKRIQARKATEDDTIISSRSQMIEVCSESSFQPLFQLYLYLPILVVSIFRPGKVVNTSKSIKETFTDVKTLQLWSIITSCLSLAWSFTFYQSVKKNGALDFGANAFGRILLLVSNILQIATRLLVFVLLAYCCGDGNFWPAFATVCIHIVCMAALHLVDNGEWSRVAVWQAILNGISNLYLHNLILPLPKEGEKNKPKRTNQTLLRQVLVDTVFIIENILVVILAFVFGLIPDISRTGLNWFLAFIILGQFFGLLLKCAYYKFFHIWSNILVFRNPCAKKEIIV